MTEALSQDYVGGREQKRAKILNGMKKQKTLLGKRDKQVVVWPLQFCFLVACGGVPCLVRRSLFLVNEVEVTVVVACA